MVSADDAIRILVEESLGKQPARPDTDEEAQHRIKVRQNLEELRKQGLIVLVPNE